MNYLINFNKFKFKYNDIDLDPFWVISYPKCVDKRSLLDFLNDIGFYEDYNVYGFNEVTFIDFEKINIEDFKNKWIIIPINHGDKGITLKKIILRMSKLNSI